ncbi:enoyl-CoA hydratase/isomerase family protein [Solwaraspora sp. WMMD1047]|uniref:enoyl-CoA hydratase/isomerase family protein n=1 Tax=Solwaraspora sp. WMMD1047 TaxID=3016102 RepID=UPI002416A49E|nr:enoyl-CoA hydratase/isomerase family protein [Solwaraspora sp. WMMD1047]MDG4834357.1 enoyl-CoA hydratase/isomerase family protein [Solwaraspora sp. WMMD1047]
MSYEHLVYTRRDRVGHVLLNRPRQLNALNQRLQQELWEVVNEAEDDPEVGVLVFSGAPRPDGRGAFSAGADMKEMATAADPGASPEGVAELVRLVMSREPVFTPPLVALCSRLETMRTPSIAAIDGVCTAGGLELALACDIRLAADTAQISDLHMKNLGHIGGGGVSVRLARTVGSAWAKQIMFTGEPIEPATALRIGLVNEVFPRDGLLDAAFGLAAKVAARRPEALAMAKSVMLAAADLDLETALRYSLVGRASLYSRSGYQSFAER